MVDVTELNKIAISSTQIGHIPPSSCVKMKSTISPRDVVKHPVFFKHSNNPQRSPMESCFTQATPTSRGERSSANDSSIPNKGTVIEDKYFEVNPDKTMYIKKGTSTTSTTIQHKTPPNNDILRNNLRSNGVEISTTLSCNPNKDRKDNSLTNVFDSSTFSNDINSVVLNTTTGSSIDDCNSIKTTIIPTQITTNSFHSTSIDDINTKCMQQRTSTSTNIEAKPQNSEQIAEDTPTRHIHQPIEVQTLSEIKEHNISSSTQQKARTRQLSNDNFKSEIVDDIACDDDDDNEDFIETKRMQFLRSSSFKTVSFDKDSENETKSRFAAIATTSDFKAPIVLESRPPSRVSSRVSSRSSSMSSGKRRSVPAIAG